MSETYTSFTELGGIPVLFAWQPLPPTPEHASVAAQFIFRAANKLIDALVASVSAISEAAPATFGKLISISSGGALKPVSGYHGIGLACDVVDIRWESSYWHSHQFARDPFLYLAVECHFRKHFGTVRIPNRELTSTHFHVDLGTPATFTILSESRVAFVQSCLHYVYGELIEIDGCYGPQTDTSLRRIKKTLGLDSLDKKAHWLCFLDTTAKLAFDKSAGRAR